MSYSRYEKKKAGFTIPELMLAMSFISVLLILLTLSATYVIATYNKGLTLKRVNQSGRTIGDTLQSSLRDSTQAIPGGAAGTTRLCTGRYTFIWTLYNNASGSAAGVTTEKYSDDTDIGFAKVDDNGQDYCDDPTLKPSRDESTELLADGLVLRAPTRFIANPDRKLVSAIYTISTPNGDSEFAAPPTSGSSVRCDGGGRVTGDDFCALNTFVVTAYIRGYNSE